MSTSVQAETNNAKYAKCIVTSKRIRWDIDQDVIRNRSFDVARKFLPDGLSKLDALKDLLSAEERRLLSQIQGRTYAAIFCLVERFISAKVLELTHRHWLGDQVALEALVRFADEEIKHQVLFRRLEAMMAAVMPAGYAFDHDPDAIARLVLSKSTWAVLGLTCHIELFTQEHYRQSIAPDSELSELFKDVFLFHWKEESQHAILDELEWDAEDKRISAEDRDSAVDELIALVGAVDGLLQAQSKADIAYFMKVARRPLDEAAVARVQAATLAAYRYQYIVSGVTNPRFSEMLFSKLNEHQKNRVGDALGPLLN